MTEKYDVTMRAASAGDHDVRDHRLSMDMERSRSRKPHNDARNGEQCPGGHVFSDIWRPTIGEQLSGRSALPMMPTLMHDPGS